jgi:hypothetical protein
VYGRLTPLGLAVLGFEHKFPFSIITHRVPELCVWCVLCAVVMPSHLSEIRSSAARRHGWMQELLSYFGVRAEGMSKQLIDA